MTREEILRSMEYALESDKRTIKNPISEYGWLFDKIYEWKKSLELEPCEDKRPYIKVFADLEPDDIAKKIYQICDDDKFPKVIESLKEYFDSKPCDDLCKSCDTKGCIFQSGIKREKCDFYTPKKCGMSDEQIRTVNDMLTCDDAISRAYIEPLVEELENIYINRDEYVLDILSNIKNAPSVTPQQKVGRWIRVDKDKLKCSECEVIHFIAQYPQSAQINYCPNCGVKMEVSEND